MEDSGLKVLAKKRKMNIGTAINSTYLKDRVYRKIIKREFNIATPEWEMIFKNIHPYQNKYNFRMADKVVKFAKINMMKTRGHPLVWHNAMGVGLPNWIKNGNFKRKELIEILKDHIETLVKRYKEVSEWTVINEGIDDKANLRKSVWLEGIGPEYIEMAFHFAHKANPKAKLYYNDYCIDDINKKSDTVYRLAKALLKKGAPIHGIGLQMHLVEEHLPNPKSVDKNVVRFKKLGLDVAITEMDVRIKKPVTEKKLKNQAKIYNEIMKVALKTECKNFIFWGFNDALSWISWYFKDYAQALIFDRKYRPKMAYYKIKEAFQ